MPRSNGKLQYSTDDSNGKGEDDLFALARASKAETRSPVNPEDYKAPGFHPRATEPFAEALHSCGYTDIVPLHQLAERLGKREIKEVLRNPNVDSPPNAWWWGEDPRFEDRIFVDEHRPQTPLIATYPPDCWRRSTETEYLPEGHVRRRIGGGQIAAAPRVRPYVEAGPLLDRLVSQNQDQILSAGYYIASETLRWDVTDRIWLAIDTDRVARVYTGVDPRPEHIPLGVRCLPSFWSQPPLQQFRVTPIWETLDFQLEQLRTGFLVEADLVLTWPLVINRDALVSWHYLDLYGGLLIDSVQVRPTRQLAAWRGGVFHYTWADDLPGPARGDPSIRPVLEWSPAPRTSRTLSYPDPHDAQGGQ